MTSRCMLDLWGAEKLNVPVLSRLRPDSPSTYQARRS